MIWHNLFGRFLRSRSGGTAITFALLTPVLVGGAALGFETSSWYTLERQEQNAADAAVVAAASNGAANYVTEARAVAARYGFVHGSNNVTVVASNSATCPNGGTTCYSVTITKGAPLYLAPIVGYQGNTTVSDGPGVRLVARAVARQGTRRRKYCLLALSTVGTDLTSNGGPQADFTGCSIMSDSSATCHGHNLKADYGDAHVNSDGCGYVSESYQPIVYDPYTGLAANIPANTCSSYPQAPSKNKDPALPSSNIWSGNKSLGGNVQVCGDLQLSSDVTIDAPSNAVLIIRNGRLDTNGHTLKTTTGSGLTVVYSGTNTAGYMHAPTGGGMLDYAAPTSGPWSGVALYQDPALTTGMDISDAGNSPAWKITGLVYLPHSNVTFSGVVNKASYGQSCFALVVDRITINGTAAIVSHGGCEAAGLDMPSAERAGRGELVQ